VRFLCAVVCVLVGASGGAAAQPSAAPLDPSGYSYNPSSPQEDLLPAALEVYSSSEVLTSRTFSGLSSVVSTGHPEVLARPPVLAFQGGSDSESDGGSTRYLPVLFSALIPGTGEIYLGHKWRGAALIALEAAAWTGYFYYRDKGLDSRSAYEGFADKYWSISKWIDDHPLVYPQNLSTPEQMDSVGMVHSGSEEWPGYIPWVSKQEDKQHYYENIGKYDWYISGWSDYNPDADPFMRDTDLRNQYRDMRKKSNDQLETADNFVYLSLGVRVFSIVETLFLARAAGDDGGSGAAEEETEGRLHLHARPKGFDGGEVFLQYSFK
jgi:hypothetical protein